MLENILLFKLDVNSWILLGIIKAKPTCRSLCVNHSKLQL